MPSAQSLLNAMYVGTLFTSSSFAGCSLLFVVFSMFVMRVKVLVATPIIETSTSPEDGQNPKNGRIHQTLDFSSSWNVTSNVLSLNKRKAPVKKTCFVR